MSDLHRAVVAEIDSYRPPQPPPFAAIRQRKRTRDRRQYALAGTALTVVAGAGLALAPTREGDVESRLGRAASPPSSATVDKAAVRSLAQLFDNAPEWPGKAWSKDGRSVPTSELALARGPEHCEWQESLWLSGSALSAPRDDRGPHWVRDPKGVLTHAPYAKAGFRARAVLPADARDTGYAQGPVELWVAASDRADFVYLVNARDRADVERWVRAAGGCA